MPDYYSYGQFYWTRDQIEWALKNREFFKDGVWPPEHRESGYVDSIHSRNYPSNAPFVPAMVIWGEIQRRLAKTGLDRILVEHSYCDQETDHEIAKRYNMTEDKVRHLIDASISYVSSGKCARWQACSGETWYCLLYQKCRKHRPALTYQDWKNHRQSQWQQGNKKKGA